MGNKINGKYKNEIICSYGSSQFGETHSSSSKLRRCLMVMTNSPDSRLSRLEERRARMTILIADLSNLLFRMRKRTRNKSNQRPRWYHHHQRLLQVRFQLLLYPRRSRCSTSMVRIW